MIYFLISSAVILNLVTFIVYGLDKHRAQNKKSARRIPERVLLIMAAAGGSIGALSAMRMLRHKTQHAKFKYGIPAILILQVVVTIYLLM